VRQRGSGADMRDPAGSGRGRAKWGAGRAWADPEKTRSGPDLNEQ
jgi:hypothetical protein